MFIYFFGAQNQNSLFLFCKIDPKKQGGGGLIGK
jgi:hypothetical protein